MDKSQTRILNLSIKVSAGATKFLSHLGNQNSFLPLVSTNSQTVCDEQSGPGCVTHEKNIQQTNSAGASENIHGLIIEHETTRC